MTKLVWDLVQTFQVVGDIYNPYGIDFIIIARLEAMCLELSCMSSPFKILPESPRVYQEHRIIIFVLWQQYAHVEGQKKDAN